MASELELEMVSEIVWEMVLEMVSELEMASGIQSESNVIDWATFLLKKFTMCNWLLFFFVYCFCLKWT